MESARLTDAYRAYFEDMLGLPLRDGLRAENEALFTGKSPFLLGCLAMEVHGPHGVTRAERPRAGPLPARAYAKENARQYRIFMPSELRRAPGSASRIREGEKVFGASRVPDMNWACGVRYGGAVVSWASAADVGGVWNITIETQRAYRGRGYASDCLCALTAWLLEAGKAPIFLCEQANAASSSTAERAGYQRYGTLFRWMP